MSDARLEIVVRNATRDDLNTLVKYNAAMAKETEGKTLDLELSARVSPQCLTGIAWAST